jgi:hypothetical protein
MLKHSVESMKNNNFEMLLRKSHTLHSHFHKTLLFRVKKKKSFVRKLLFSPSLWWSQNGNLKLCWKLFCKLFSFFGTFERVLTWGKPIPPRVPNVKCWEHITASGTQVNLYRTCCHICWPPAMCLFKKKNFCPSYLSCYFMFFNFLFSSRREDFGCNKKLWNE